MTFVRKSYGDIIDSIFSHLTRGVIQENFEYAGEGRYGLDYHNVKGIISLIGFFKGYSHTFIKGHDYALAEEGIEWIKGGDRPDNHSIFSVSYLVDAPRTITDINPGSVTRTLVESIALEIDYMNSQMSQVYNSGFIDTAAGKSLDLVASILGISRKPAGFASGNVTFGRNGEPGSYEVQKEAHVYDGQIRYELKNPMVKDIKKIEATTSGVKSAMTEGQDFEVGEGSVTWRPAGRRPDVGSIFYIDYSSYEKIVIPRGTNVSTYSRIPENIKAYRVARDTTIGQAEGGAWEAEAPVIALEPGRAGNVFAGSINVMPAPVPGIEYVINKNDILNGTELEGDDDFRDRARRVLETAGKATVRSLRSAVQGIEGVVGEVVVIDRPGEVPGITQIIASGGDDAQIRQVIEDTRAAGILVEFKRPRIVSLDIKLTVRVAKGRDGSAVKSRVDSVVRRYVESINIGEDPLVSKIIGAAMAVEGVDDVYDVSINDRNENVNIRLNEKGELRTLDIYSGENGVKKG